MCGMLYCTVRIGSLDVSDVRYWDRDRVSEVTLCVAPSRD